MNTNSNIRIFISYSILDRHIAGSIINLLKKSCSLSNDEIRCTNENGSKVFDGDIVIENVDRDILIDEAVNADVFICIITINSLKSVSMLFDFALMYGSGNLIFPFICLENIDNLLSIPVRKSDFIHLNNRHELIGFLEKVSGTLNISMTPYSIWIDEVDNLYKKMIFNKI